MVKNKIALSLSVTFKTRMKKIIIFFSLPDLLAPLQLNMNDVSADIRNLIYTFKWVFIIINNFYSFEFEVTERHNLKGVNNKSKNSIANFADFITWHIARFD